MTNVKERILGAITIMSDEDADLLWKMIIDNFSKWSNIEEVEPDETDIAMIREIETDPDCQSFVSSEEAMKELGII